jgi:hypothetical protein
MDSTDTSTLAVKTYLRVLLLSLVIRYFQFRKSPNVFWLDDVDGADFFGSRRLSCNALSYSHCVTSGILGCRHRAT